MQIPDYRTLMVVAVVMALITTSQQGRCGGVDDGPEVVGKRHSKQKQDAERSSTPVDTKQPKEPGMLMDITGYGDYKLGESRQTFDLDDFEFRSDPLVDGADEYFKADVFQVYDRTLTDELRLYFVDDVLVAVEIYFPDLSAHLGGDLDTMGRTVSDIRKMIWGKYDKSLKRKDKFSFTEADWTFKLKGRSRVAWTGYLELRDDQEDALMMNWTGPFLDIQYVSKDAVDKFAAAAKERAAETKNNL